MLLAEVKKIHKSKIGIDGLPVVEFLYPTLEQWLPLFFNTTQYRVIGDDNIQSEYVPKEKAEQIRMISKKPVARMNTLFFERLWQILIFQTIQNPSLQIWITTM
jgi:hypothetical protein